MTIAVAIRLVTPVVGGPTEHDGAFVKHYDPDAHDGRGHVESTLELNKAKRFHAMTEAMAYWRQTSRVQPVRSDGQPNRPLTAYTVEFVTVEKS